MYLAVFHKTMLNFRDFLGALGHGKMPERIYGGLKVYSVSP